ncbi:Alpha/Beta hydrolase protein, partial [Mycena rosella]
KVVDLGYTTYQSDLSFVNGVTSFLGIRYAASPTGKAHNFPPPKVPGIHNATSPPRQCHHVPLMGTHGRSTTSPFRKPVLEGPQGVSPYSEDCLFLKEGYFHLFVALLSIFSFAPSVHVPSERKPKSLLPVIVYIHGGGYDAGSVTLYPMQDFVTLSNFGVVSVAIQYRLGVFDFLPGENIKQTGDLAFFFGQSPMNAHNISELSSQSDHMGQSAGAGCMLQHVVAYGGNTQPQLFRAVIANSPYLLPHCSGSNDSIVCHRDTPAATLLAAGSEISASSFLGLFTFLPVVDGAFIVERPSVTLQRGQVNGMLLLTTNEDEGALFVNPDALVHNKLTLREYTRELFPRLDRAQVEHVVRLYANTGREDTVNQASEIIGHCE